MRISVPALPEATYEKAYKIFKILVRKKVDRVKAIAEAAKKVGSSFNILRESMTEHLVKKAEEKTMLKEMTAAEIENEKNRKMGEDHEIASGHAHLDEDGVFVDDLSDRVGRH